jgi:cyanate permease
LVCIYLVVLFVLSLVPILGILFNFLGILAYYCVVLPVVYIFVYKLYKEIKAIKSKNSKAKEDVKVWKKVILVLLYTGFISIIFILILGLGYFTVGSYNYMQDQGEFKEINIMEDFR